MNSIQSALPGGLTGTSQSNSSDESLGQQDFLRLMLKQLENQDPTKPMESADFLSQIAQFGTVSGIKDLNSSFQGVSSALVQEQSLRAASLLDRQVLADVDSVRVDESGPMRGAVQLPAGATQATVEIIGPGGQQVDSVRVSGSAGALAEFSWDAMRDDGTRVPAGDYRARAATAVDGEAQAAPVLLNAQVKGIELDSSGGSVRVDIGSANSVRLEDIRRID